MKKYNRFILTIFIVFIFGGTILYNQKKEKIKSNIDQLHNLKKEVNNKKMELIENIELEISKLINEKNYIKKILDNRNFIEKTMFDENENVGNYFRNMLYKENVMFKNVSEPEIIDNTTYHFYKKIIFLDLDSVYLDKLTNFVNRLLNDKFFSENGINILLEFDKSQIGIEYYTYRDLDDLEKKILLIDEEIEKLKKEVENVKDK